MNVIIFMFFGYKNSTRKALVLYKLFALLSPRLILDTGEGIVTDKTFCVVL